MSSLGKTVLVCVFMMVVTMLAGCGSGTTAGAGGILGGFAASETLKGMQADLDQREQSLIAQYNAIIEAGSKAGDLATKADELEALKVQIADTVRLRQTSEVPAVIAKTEWTDPKAAGGAIGTIASLGYAWLKRKDLNNTVAGIRTFRAKADEATKQQLDQVLLDKKAAT